MAWIPLHLHSQFSILDATASVKEIAKAAAADKMPAVALTDHGNLYGAVDFYKACKENGVKPIIGCEFYVAPESRFEKSRHSTGKTAFHLILLAKDTTGYRNLSILSSKGFAEGFYYNPRIDKELLQQYSEGLICLSACLSSSVAYYALNDPSAMEQEIEWHRALFKEDYYLEIQRHGMTPEQIAADGMRQEPWWIEQHLDFIQKQNKANELIIAYAKKHKIPLVATNDSHYIKQSEWRAHEILLNIGAGDVTEIWEKDSMGNLKTRIPNPKRRTYASHELYFKSQSEMQELFKDIPEALSNTLLVAEKCHMEFDFKTKHYPVFIPPFLAGKTVTEHEQKAASVAYLHTLCEEGIVKRYTAERLAKVAEQYPGKDPMQVVVDRLKYETEIIVSKGMCDYILIVADFINWAKRQSIPMGPGRGSGAGSIICYLIGITDIEPLRFNLFFERFINPERISYPDIDVDICMDRRSEVIDYMTRTYGNANVAQIITFGTMKAKMAIKDVGRVLNIPLAKVNDIAKLVPEDPNMTLEKALETDPDLLRLSQEDPDAKRIISLAKELEGSIRNTGVHAAGIIVSSGPVVNTVPTCTAKDSSMAVTQFSMKPVEAVGMLKIDFLGLKTLTCIQKAADAVVQNHHTKIDWVNLALDDPQTFDLLSQGRTTGVFQVESAGMQELNKQLHPDRFEEIIAIGSLYRPGPMDMIPSFIARKHKREPIDYDHPLVAEILEETYGIMVYQEQVMQIAQKLANYSLGEGDVLRRAMGKKDHAEMMRQREKFLQGATANGIDHEVAVKIFDKMEKFAAYGFNKSHAAAYGYLTYVTAYFKAHYPREWMAALMTCDSADLSKVAKHLRECQQMHIPILPPGVNEADVEFRATQEGIRFAMNGIKGLGNAAAEAIVEERTKNGAFESLFDFFERIDSKKITKKSVESLVDAGAFDFTGWTRDALRLSIEGMQHHSARAQREKAAGVLSFFDLVGSALQNPHETPPEVANPSSKQALLSKEKELLGFFLTGHPMDEYRSQIERMALNSLHDITRLIESSFIRVAFIVESVQVRITQQGQRKFAILRIGDGIDSIEAMVWPQLFEKVSHLLQENRLLCAVLEVEKKTEGDRISCHWLQDLTIMDDAEMAACDRAFDSAKAAVKRSQMAKKMAAEKTTMQSANHTLHITLDISKLTLSRILALKECFLTHGGSHPVNVVFIKDQRPLADLGIDSQWGVRINEELTNELKRFEFVTDVSIA